MAGLVRRVGGGGLAVTLAWLAFALSPYYLYAFHYLSMNAPEVLWWSTAALLLFDATSDRRPRTAGLGEPALPAARSQVHRAWLAFGALMGVAALTKVSGLVWGAGLAAGLALSPGRRYLRSHWAWAAVAIAVVLFVPEIATTFPQQMRAEQSAIKTEEVDDSMNKLEEDPLQREGQEEEETGGSLEKDELSNTRK